MTQKKPEVRQLSLTVHRTFSVKILSNDGFLAWQGAIKDHIHELGQKCELLLSGKIPVFGCCTKITVGELIGSNLAPLLMLVSHVKLQLHAVVVGIPDICADITFFVQCPIQPGHFFEPVVNVWIQ